MIICRKCLTQNDDDADVCTHCGADLAEHGLRPQGAMRSDWDPNRPASPPTRSAPPQSEPRPAAPPTTTPPATAAAPDEAGDRPPPISSVPSSAGSVREPVAPAEADSSQPPQTPQPQQPSVATAAASDTPVANTPSGARRGRRPGERDDEEVEPDTNSGPVPAAAPSPQQVVDDDRVVPAREESAVPAVARVGAPVQPGALTAVPGVAVADRGDGARCPSCSRWNPFERRFCGFCGAALPALAQIDDVEDIDDPSDSWWRRLTGTTRTKGTDNRTFGQRMRDSGQDKLKYRAKYSVQSRLRALGLIGGGLAGLVILLGPVRAQVTEWLDPPDAAPVSAVVITDTAPVADAFGAEGATDADDTTALVLPWAGEPVSFQIELDPDRSADELEFVTGFPNDDVQGRGPLYLRPAVVELTSGTQTFTIELADQEGSQRRGLRFDEDPSTIDVTIVEVHERPWETYQRVAIAEIGVAG